MGLNMALNERDAEGIDQPWAALSAYKADLSRNQVASVLLDELLAAVDEFQREGFENFQQYWSERDVFHEKNVVILSPNKSLEGMVKGVNRKGELLLRTEHGMEVINAGEISVRAAD